MNVSIERPDLITLCKQVAVTASPEDHKGKFRAAFKRREFVNGYLYTLNLAWVEEQTDLQLFEFYQAYSPTIKLL